MELATLANLAEIFGALLVVAGLAFGLFELRNYRLQRQEAAAMEIMRAFQSEAFTKALRLVMKFEDECTGCREADMSPELEDAAMLIATTIEAIGLMVYRRIVPYALVQELMGGTIGASWRVLRPYVEMLRDRLARPSLHEWFQWLAERLDEYPEYREGEGAHLKYDAWRPERAALARREKRT
jgi:hypothetical protein